MSTEHFVVRKGSMFPVGFLRASVDPVRSRYLVVALPGRVHHMGDMSCGMTVRQIQLEWQRVGSCRPNEYVPFEAFILAVEPCDEEYLFVLSEFTSIAERYGEPNETRRRQALP